MFLPRIVPGNRQQEEIDASTARNDKESAMNRNSNPQTSSSTVHTVVASAFGLLPVGVVSGMMLMQILGYWAY
jgi:hypothetical protein